MHALSPTKALLLDQLQMLADVSARAATRTAHEARHALLARAPPAAQTRPRSRRCCVECDDIGDASGARDVFNRVNYCPLACNTNPTGPGCVMGGSGMF